MAEPVYDVAIVGGGVNGTGLARDCALRGLRVVLFEKHDFAFGASGNNSGMIHGGPRYLMKQPSVTEESCRDSGYIQRIAPHLLFRIPFLLPIPARRRTARLYMTAVDAFFAFYDRYQPLKRGKAHTLLTPHQLQTLEPGIQGEYVGAVTFDEWGIDGARLCVLNAIDAEAHGADVYTHHEVFDIVVERENGRRCVRGLRARDALTGVHTHATAKIVVNATGAWSPITAALADQARVQVRPGKGIHVVYDHRLSNYGIVTHAIDGRQIFLMPWQNISWIATTDDDFYGDLDRVTATTDEVRYLVQGIARTFPAVKDARIIGTTAGVRPTLFGWGVHEDALSRDHAIVDHAGSDGIDGLLSLIGGKLASYRLFSEQAADAVCRRLGIRSRCVTHTRPLPGGDEPRSPADLAEKFGIEGLCAKRLIGRHGSRADRILERTRRCGAEATVVCPCEPVLECEIRHACREEGARVLADVARRTRLGLGSCGGLRCAHRAAQIVAEETGANAQTAHRMAVDFIRERYASRVVGLNEVQARHEELLSARFASGGLTSCT